MTTSVDLETKGSWLAEIDALVKLIIALGLAVTPFLCRELLSLGVIAVFLIGVTLTANLRWRPLMLSAASFGIIVLVPYLFGLLVSWLMARFSISGAIAGQQAPYEMFLRLFRLFVIWYVSILYFYTTSLKTVLGLVAGALAPLKRFGLAVDTPLKVVMCVILELKDMGTDVRRNLGKQMQEINSDNGGKLKINVKGISQLIVSVIVGSFDRLSKVQARMEALTTADLYNYRLKVAGIDLTALAVFALLAAALAVVEKGLWP